MIANNGRASVSASSSNVGRIAARTALLASVCVFVAEGSALADGTATWNGTITNNFVTTGNWTGVGFTGVNNADLTVVSVVAPDVAPILRSTDAVTVDRVGIDSGKLRIDGDLTATNGVTVTGGTLTLTAAGSIVGTTDVKAGGKMTNGGTVGAVTNAGTFANTGKAGAVTNSGTGNNSGTIASLINSTGTFTDNGEITGNAKVDGGTVKVTSAGSIGGTTTIGAAGTVKNNGTVQAVVNAGTFDNTGVAASLTNTGTATNAGSISGNVSVDAGKLTTTGVIDGKLTNKATTAASGEIAGAIDNSGTLDVTGNLLAGSTLTNSGTLEVKAGTFGGVTTLTNTSKVIVDGGARLTVGTKIDNKAGGTIDVKVGGIVDDDLTNAGTVTNAGTYNATVASNTGKIENTGTWNGDVTTSSGTIENKSTWNGDMVSNSGTLTNSGTWNGKVVTSGTFDNSGKAGAVTNSGTATNSGTVASLVNTAGTFDNSGTITGTAKVDGGKVTNSGTIGGASTVKAGATLTNTGTVADVTNAGTFDNKGAAAKAGAVTNSGTATNSGTVASLVNTAGTFDNSGKITGTAKVDGGKVTNSGTIGGASTVKAGATLTNTGTVADVTNAGTFDNKGAAAKAGAVSSSGTGTNSGTIASLSTSAGTFGNSGTVSGSASINGGTFNTTGKVGGSLANKATTNASGVVTGPITNSGQLYVTGNLSTAGTVDNTAGLIEVQAGTFSGVTVFTNGAQLIVDGGATLTIATRLDNLAGGSVLVKAGGTLNDVLNNAGTVTNAGTYNAVVATNSGTIVNQNIWNGDVTTTSGKIDNQGTWTGNLLANTGTLTNSGTWAGNVTSSGTIKLSGSITGTVANSGTVVVDGATASTGDFTNSGTVDLADGATGDRLTVNTVFKANAGSTILVDVDLSHGIADTVNATKLSGGATTVNFTRLSPNGFGFFNPIMVVAGTPDAGVTFVEGTGLPASGSLVDYSFERIAGGWGVVSKLNGPAVGATAGGIAASITAITTGFAEPTSAFITGPADPKQDQVAFGIWARTKAGRYVVDSDTTATGRTTASRYESQFMGVQAGIDGGIFDIGGSGLNAHLGLTAGSVKVYNRDTLSATTSKSEVEAPFFGLYGALTGHGFFADLQVQRNFYDIRVTNAIAGLKGTKVGGQGYSALATVGKVFPIGERWFIEPSLGLSYAFIDVGGVPIGNIGTLGLDRLESLIGSARLRVGTAYAINEDVILRPSVQASWWQEFAGNATAIFDPNVAAVARVPVSTDRVGGFGQIGVSIAAQQVSTGLTGFVRGDYRYGEKIYGGSITAGLRYTF